jgi:hypothetical protein
MRLFGRGNQARTVVRTYGRGSVLGLISPILAFFMASRGMDGWRQSAVRDMEKDMVAMARRGYRVAATEEREIPPFGISWYRVTYELAD